MNAESNGQKVGSREVDKARYIMIGGFLGAGKTTAVARFARFLVDRGKRVGLISNDQSTDLVDTAMLRSKGFSVEEIAGGCFCCRFNSLVEAAGRLTDETRPEVFIAEPVGSCTDLVATVSYPLRRIYGDRFSIAPLSVLIDPHRAARILELESGRPFSSKVVYVYKKQLEEARFLVVNKCDELEESLRAALVNRLEELYPRAKVFCVSARRDQGLEAWFESILQEPCGVDPTMEVDYEVYAEGEALLGWLNATVEVASEEEFDANEVLLDLSRVIRDGVVREQGEIAHLKMTLDVGDPTGNLSVVSLVRSDQEPDLRESLLDEVRGGHLVLNLRAEASPEALQKIVRDGLAEIESSRSVSAPLKHIECFRPGKPEPTHRIERPEAAEEAPVSADPVG